jgi:hypothetical protein
VSNDPKVGYGLAGCGCLLALVTAGVGLFGAFHFFIDPDGAISGDEAAPAMGAFCCTFVGLALAGAGIFLATRKPAAAAEGGPAPPG